ncbi:MAG: putative toxin-antitoxin system toxin component, PIN family [Pseudomonadota bacterium]|nr:putative toxin-antitoxin system toxin component, PIN family [Pseudomonadota bacterium]
MKVVIDTNVFVSGIFWKGPPSKVIDLWLDGRFELVKTPEILEEYIRITENLPKFTELGH